MCKEAKRGRHSLDRTKPPGRKEGRELVSILGPRP